MLRGVEFCASQRKGTEGRPLCRPVFFTLHFLFPIGNNPTLATPFPSVRTGDCLAAARSRRGSDMPPACHSLPRRCFATLEGAALRGKDLGLAQLSSAPPLSRFPYRRIKTAPMLLSMGAVSVCQKSVQLGTDNRAAGELEGARPASNTIKPPSKSLDTSMTFGAKQHFDNIKMLGG